MLISLHESAFNPQNNWGQELRYRYHPTLPTMEGGSAGRIITLRELTLRHYDYCKKIPESFENLHSNLLSLHEELQKAESLPFPSEDLDAIYSECENVLCDVGKLLNIHDSYVTTKKELWKMFKWYSADISQLKSRLTAQVHELRQHVW